MDTIYRYYGIQFLDGQTRRTIYIARSERERENVMQWFKDSDDAPNLRIVDYTRPTKMPKAKMGFQNMEFWMARQNMAVAS